MTAQAKSQDVVIVEESDTYFLQFEKAWKEIKIPNALYHVKNAGDLAASLPHPDKVAASLFYPKLIFIDLQMPGHQGMRALQKIKSDPHLRKTPIIGFIKDQSQAEIVRSYDLGVNSVAQKPISYKETVTFLNTVAQYWFNTVLLPPPKK